MYLAIKKNQDFLACWALNWSTPSITMHKMVVRRKVLTRRKKGRTRAVLCNLEKAKRGGIPSKIPLCGYIFFLLKSFVVKSCACVSWVEIIIKNPVGRSS